MTTATPPRAGDDLLDFILAVNQPADIAHVRDALADFRVDTRPAVLRVLAAVRGRAAARAAGPDVDDIIRHCARARVVLNPDESLTCAVIGATLGGVIVSWSEEAERLYGYSAREMTGREVMQLTPPDEAAVLADMLDHVRHGDPCEPYRTRRQRKDGKRFAAEVGLYPITDAGEHEIGVLMLLHPCSAA